LWEVGFGSASVSVCVRSDSSSDHNRWPTSPVLSGAGASSRLRGSKIQLCVQDHFTEFANSIADKVPLGGAAVVAGVAEDGVPAFRAGSRHGECRRNRDESACFAFQARDRLERRLLPALRQIADPRRILYGSDWPFTPLPIVARLALALAQGATPLLDAAARRRVLHDNALALFPRAITAFAQTSDSGLVVPGSALAAVNRKLTAVSALERERGER
jgi:Amidohydrolase